MSRARRGGARRWIFPLAGGGGLLLTACHDVSSFSTASGGAYEGPIDDASFVRAGFAAGTRLCLSVDTSRLQSSPGAVSTSDGLLGKTKLRSIPQLWQDPLSTLNFGEGRVQNVVYVAHGGATEAGVSGDVFVVVSFMDSGQMEARLLRGAPGDPSDGKEPAPSSLFGVFTLSRTDHACAY